MEETIFIKCEPEWPADTEQSHSCGLPLKTDSDDTGGISTLLPKVERESSPSGWCEGNGKDEEQLPLHTNDKNAKSSDRVDQNEAKKQESTVYSRDLGETSFQQVDSNVHYYITAEGDICIGTSGTMKDMHHADESQSSSGQSFKSEGLMLPDTDNATYSRNTCDVGYSSYTLECNGDITQVFKTGDVKCKDNSFQEGGVVFENEQNESHMNEFHSVYPPQLTLENNFLNSQAEQIACTTCGRAFTSMSTNGNNQLYYCSFCDKATAFAVKDSHLKQLTDAGDETLICTICQKISSGRLDHEAHIETHVKYKHHFCPFCGKIFKKHFHLQYHISTNHVKTEKNISKPLPLQSRTVLYSCKSCSKVFVSQYSLNVHMLRHTGGKPHICRWCGQAFSTSSDLRSHLFIHQYEKPFVCITCEKPFLERTKLHAHLLTHK
ncbi:zinc finger protein OZF [Anabrus simplex]|uniref:zinc finger protein OZF n=1 Tax=Anabrus simplex TaxID=316456 RepID=UPI0035A35011